MDVVFPGVESLVGGKMVGEFGGWIVLSWEGDGEGRGKLG